MAPLIWRSARLALASYAALASSVAAAPPPRPAVPASVTCDGWQTRLAEMQRPGAGYLVGEAIISPAVSAGQAQQRAGEQALTALIQQISSHVDSVTTVRESSGADAERRASLELTLRSRLSLRNYSREDCYDAAKLEYRSRVAVGRDVLLRTAQAQLGERNAEGRQSLARARRALDGGDPLSALKNLADAERQRGLAEEEAVVVQALGDAAAGQCFATRGDLEQLGQRARSVATLQLVFPPEMDGLEASIRTMLGGLQLRTVDTQPLVVLRGSFRGISDPARTANQMLVFRAVVHVDIALARSGAVIDSVQVAGRDGDTTRPAALRRISEHNGKEVTRALRQKIALAFGIALEPEVAGAQARAPGSGTGRTSSRGVMRP